MINQLDLRRLSYGMRLVSAYLLIAFSTQGAYGTDLPQRRPADTLEQRVIACVACHGKENRAVRDAYYPRIAGKPAGYLYNQLLNFRDGRRRSPAMTYFADNLPDDYLREIATYFAAQHLPYPPPPAGNAPKPVIERGRELVTAGDAANGIPACAACHGDSLTGVNPSIPGLIGLPRDYVNAQFGAWRIGARRAAAPDCMAEIARRLSAADVTAVSAYLATAPVPDNALPAGKAARTLPLECGSVAQTRAQP